MTVFEHKKRDFVLKTHTKTENEHKSYKFVLVSFI